MGSVIGAHREQRQSSAIFYPEIADDLQRPPNAKLDVRPGMESCAFVKRPPFHKHRADRIKGRLLSPGVHVMDVVNDRAVQPPHHSIRSGA
jgi:hypothetical protein